MSRPLLVLCALTLVATTGIAACGDDGDPDLVTRTVTDDVTVTDKATVTSTVRGGAGTSTSDDVEVRTPAPVLVPVPVPTTVTSTVTDTTTRLQDPCRDLPEFDDGTYVIGDAGTVEVRRVADVLILGDVDASEGWSHDVTEEDRDEIRVQFRQDGRDARSARELTLRTDDGELRVRLCVDVG